MLSELRGVTLIHQQRGQRRVRPLDVLSARAGNNSMRLGKIAQVTSREDRSIRLTLTPREAA